MNKDQNSQPSSQQGTGSAENKGSNRSEQGNKTTHLSKKEKQNIAGDVNLSSRDIASLNDLGAASGRDDYAGGDNEGMSNESTNERTEQ
jgi:hypothetical protein